MSPILKVPCLSFTVPPSAFIRFSSVFPPLMSICPLPDASMTLPFLIVIALRDARVFSPFTVTAPLISPPFLTMILAPFSALSPFPIVTVSLKLAAALFTLMVPSVSVFAPLDALRRALSFTVMFFTLAVMEGVPSLSARKRALLFSPFTLRVSTSRFPAIWSFPPFSTFISLPLMSV